jgi:mono/diheme cytochrome c family protein
MHSASCRLASVLVLTLAAVASAAPPPASAVDFNRDVRPILAGKCFACHGPDDKARKAGLRLDLPAAAAAKLRSGARAVVPGKPAESELLRRVGADEDEIMPPPRVGKRLAAEEIATLRRWIEQGAPYAQHWAYVKPVRPEPPAVRDVAWPRNPIDRFLLARLEKEGLRPAPQADRYALARRLALDLTGLPPTPEQADRFVRDGSPHACEDYVDRLLASPAYGERWAHVWLDLARYADSQGYANDPERTIWRWRDWVIEALNDNMPYDRFTVEQLAGDLLPAATQAQLIATGFHRNTLTNTEGGTNPEEFRSAAVVDRVNTTLQVWMGVTIACAQCHNHKYDPFTQKEYYQLYAIFNNCQDANGGDDAPTLPVPYAGQEKAFAEASARLPEVRKKLDEETRKVDARQAQWEKSVDRKSLPKEIADIVALPPEKREKAQRSKLTAYHRAQSPAWKALDSESRQLPEKLKRLGTTTPILREGKPRETFVHVRGNFLDKGEKVVAGLPAVFGQPPAGEVLNRLALARWLVSPDNPLTARVAVNRLWEEVFGTGIVETSENFGTQGEPPFHPELLDWLATEYVRIGWDTKKMLKLLVTSAAYRQSSQVSEEVAKRDPKNRLLARGPRVRLPAETIRDQALFVGGLLSPKMYGPPVQPPRPAFGLTAAFGGTTDWSTSDGEDKYRRGLYVRCRRNAPYPPMTTFDAPERTVCNVRRLRTNTPLQALVTLNDPVFVEAAQALGRRMAARAGTTASGVEHGFRLCLTRPPRPDETKRLVDLFEKSRGQFAANPAGALALATKPLGPAPTGMDVVDLAAWTVVANVLLNLDETLAKR